MRSIIVGYLAASLFLIDTNGREYLKKATIKDWKCFRLNPQYCEVRGVRGIILNKKTP